MEDKKFCQKLRNAYGEGRRFRNGKGRQQK